MSSVKEQPVHRPTLAAAQPPGTERQLCAHKRRSIQITERAVYRQRRLR